MSERVVRITGIIQVLSDGRFHRAEDLAQRFEVSKRTIYRDLEEASLHYPIQSQTGRGYRLMNRANLPPITFTAPEATTLMLGADFVARAIDSEFRSHATTATTKIQTVLPQPEVAKVEYLRNSLRFHGQGNAHLDQALRVVRTAIVDQVSIQFDYRARFPSRVDDALTARLVDPYSLVHQNGTWYVVGYDHMRQELRNFRLERASNVTLTDQPFQRPQDFQPALHQVPELRTVEVRAFFTREVADWVREERNFFVSAEQAGFDGLLVTLRAHREDEVIPWLLQWGRHVRVLEPDTVRLAIAQEAQALLAAHPLPPPEEPPPPPPPPPVPAF